MTSTAAADEERRDRIVSHMNRSHTRELAHYLRHFAGASRRAASSPSLRDVTLQGMRIRAGGNDYAVPFTPPLDTWNDVRGRIIEMDATARRGLGISDVYITEYVPPRGFEIVVFGAVIFYFSSVASLPWVVPGSGLWQTLTAVYPGGPEWFRWGVRIVFLPVVAIHSTEAFLFDRKLQRHGVDRWTSLWWLWVSSCFVDGICSFRRMNSIIAQKKAQKEGNMEGKKE
ncbi:hypothetical protein TOPH_00923 [Tolypocladium ophioglossoides CBS 100239]|uniref:DUF2470 domain-containing protein n=1 Tax=Tolypocladium ophioglossoides (strain CBS 100239) TaxID=1163406 RepID=A0A0L0NJ41_TOLOC|nr:hypothetical protein TOPH_00923 [Tolypocladium ophioglossoides CBS 100239]